MAVLKPYPRTPLCKPTLNPLIGTFPSDTLNHAAYVLRFLTTTKTLDGCAIGTDEDMGLAMILDTVRVALEYESERIDLMLNPKQDAKAGNGLPD